MALDNPVGICDFPITAVQRKIKWKHIDLFICGDDGNVYTAWWTRGFVWSSVAHNWVCLGGNDFPPRAPVSALSRKPENLDLFVCGNDGHVYTKWWTEGRGWEKRWHDLGGDGLFKPGTEIAAVARRPDKIDLFASSVSGDVYKCYWCKGCGGWSGLTAAGHQWKNLGGGYHRKSAAANVAVLSRDADLMEVFFCGDDGQVRYKAWNNKVKGWDKHWKVIGGSELVPGGPITAVSRRPDQIDLFGCGADGHVYTSWWRNGWEWSGIRGGWECLGGQFPPGAWVSAVALEPEHLDIGVVSELGSMFRTWWKNGVTSWGRWTDIQSCSAPGGRTASLSVTTSTLEVFMVGNIGEVFTINIQKSGGKMGPSRCQSLRTLPGSQSITKPIPLPPKAGRSSSSTSELGTGIRTEILTRTWKLGTHIDAAEKLDNEAAPKEHGNGPRVQPQAHADPLRDETADAFANKDDKLRNRVNASEVGRSLLLFDSAATVVNPKNAQGSRSWLSSLKIAANESLQTNKRKLNDPRVKVAILDTGYDSTHPFFVQRASRIKGYKSFVPGDKEKADIHGHGTFTADLLMSVAPNANVYIARVSLGDNIDGECVGKAIKHCVDEWKVSIISMSLGLCDGSHRAIRDAIADIRKRAVIFAAASNQGSQGRINLAFPAKMRDDVIPVFSTNHMNRPSGFNPVHLKKAYSFAVLGEDVEAASPMSPRDDHHSYMVTRDGVEGRARLMSGTSVATPIAAGIAALVIEFAVNCRKAPKFVAHHLDALHTHQGMTEVFALLAKKIDSYHIIPPSLFQDCISDDHIVNEITAKMSSVI